MNWIIQQWQEHPREFGGLLVYLAVVLLLACLAVVSFNRKHRAEPVAETGTIPATEVQARIRAALPAMIADAMHRAAKRRHYSGLHFPGGVTLFAPAFIIYGCEATGSVHDKYMTRYRLFDSPTRGIYIHVMHRTDAGTDYHNHPWAFTTYVLKGGYIEEVPTVYPGWNTGSRPAFAAFQSVLRETPKYTGPEGANQPGEFCGHWEKGKEYAPGSVVHHFDFYSIRRDTPPAPTDYPKTPVTGSYTGWDWFKAETPRMLDIRPFTRHYREASHVHRVRLRTDKKHGGREIPAVTLVIRGARLPEWGFFRFSRFIPSRQYFKENGC